MLSSVSLSTLLSAFVTSNAEAVRVRVTNNDDCMRSVPLCYFIILIVICIRIQQIV